jgi:hypothetical protein
MVWSDILRAVTCFLADHCEFLRTTTLTFSILSGVLMVVVLPGGFFFKEEPVSCKF